MVKDQLTMRDERELDQREVKVTIAFNFEVAMK